MERIIDHLFIAIMSFFMFIGIATVMLIAAILIPFAYLRFIIKNYYWVIILAVLISCVAHGKSCEIKVQSYQEHQMWCWLAASEMVLDANKSCYVGLDSKQESLMRLAAHMGMKPWYCGADPKICDNEGADTAITMSRLIEQASVTSFKACKSPKIKTISTPSPITAKEVRKEVCNGRPLIIGVTLSDNIGPFPQHAVVVVGMTQSGKLIIRDPWPYHKFKGSNPWKAFGGTIREDNAVEISIKDIGKHWQDTMKFEEKHEEI